jgi:B9 domain-containing protein 1
MAAGSESSFFTLVVSGQIESAHLPEYDNLYCKFAFEAGQDFVVLEGVEEGISQFAKGKTSTWNFPIEVAWKATNFYGWPQLVIRFIQKLT